MTQDQHQALVNKLGDIKITQINGTCANVHVPFKANVDGGEEQDMAPLKEVIADFDVIAVVLPIQLQQQLVGVAGDKPIIFAKNARVRQDNGEFEFVFESWEQILEIKVVTQPFA
jgi:hypothetical protein